MTRLLGETDYRRRAETMAKELFGYKVFHPPNCRKASGAWSSQGITGWPDTTFVRPPRIVYVEFKGARTPTSAQQYATLNLLRACDCEVFIWREGVVTIDEIANYLRWKNPQTDQGPWSDPAIIGPWT